MMGHTSKEKHISGESKIKVYKWAKPDSPGVPFLIDKNNLHIDEQYQRKLTDNDVTAIAANWSYLACGALIVAEREPGRFYVIDGQHRLASAMRRDDIGELPCMVFKLSDIPAEALAFYLANCKRRPVSVYDKVRALLVCEDRETIDAIALMRSRGYEPAERGDATGVRCLGTFLSYFKRSRELFTRTWPLIAEIHEGRPILERPLSAIMYIAKYGEPDINSPYGRQRLRELGYDKINGAITRMAVVFERGGPKVYAQGVVDLLNKGRRTHTFTLRSTDGEQLDVETAKARA